MRENIRLAFQGIWSHKLRSVLTMLGIIIGIAAIITIVSTIQLNQSGYPYDMSLSPIPAHVIGIAEPVRLSL